MSADKFNYTRVGGETEIEGVDDRADMAETRRTFSLLGDTRVCFILIIYMNERKSSVVLSAVLMQCFSPGLKDSFQADVFKVLAAILHLGNVVIKENGSEKSSIGVRNMFYVDNRHQAESGCFIRSSFCSLSSPETLTWPFSVS